MILQSVLRLALLFTYKCRRVFKVKELNKNKRLREYQLDKLNDVLKYAYNNSSFYNELYSKIKPEDLVIKKFDDFRKIPVLKKESLKKAIKDNSIRAKNYNPKQLYYTSTTGSTGQPLELFFDKECINKRSLVLNRIMDSIKLKSYYRTIFIWRDKKLSIPQKVLKKTGFFLPIQVGDFNNPVSSATTKESLDEIVEKIRAFNPEVIRGYVSAIYVIASFLRQKGIKLKALRSVITSAEYLPEVLWKEFEEIFGCPVYNLYGGSEAPAIAVNNNQNHYMNLSEDLYFVEVLNEEGQPVIPGEAGLITITDFTSKAMPLIRYQIGDIATIDEKFYDLTTDQYRYLCSVEGRTNDIFELEDGSIIFSHLWYIVFRDEAWIDKFKVIQETKSKIIIYIVPFILEQEKLEDLRKRVETMYTGIIFNWMIVERIDLEKGDKFRAVMSKVDNKFNKINK